MPIRIEAPCRVAHSLTSVFLKRLFYTKYYCTLSQRILMVRPNGRWEIIFARQGSSFVQFSTLDSNMCQTYKSIVTQKSDFSIHKEFLKNSQNKKGSNKAPRTMSVLVKYSRNYHRTILVSISIESKLFIWILIARQLTHSKGSNWIKNSLEWLSQCLFHEHFSVHHVSSTVSHDGQYRNPARHLFHL